MKRKNLIINADDFGLFSDINRAVADLAKEGILTSASLIVTNSPVFEEAVQIAKELPNLSLGIHLNATYGRALTFENKAISRLCDNYGNYLSTNRTKSSMTAWEKEFRKQIETVLATGLTPCYLNTHVQLHDDEKVFKVLKNLAKEYGINGIGRVPPRLSHKIKLTTTKNYIFNNFIETKDFTRWIQREMKPGTTELIVHPGYLDLELERFCSWNRQRYAEFQALLDPKFRKALEKNKVTLISWDELINQKVKTPQKAKQTLNQVELAPGLQ